MLAATSSIPLFGRRPVRVAVWTRLPLKGLTKYKCVVYFMLQHVTV